MRIACDLDGTIADMDAALQREAKRLFGPDVDLHASAPAVRTESAEDVEGETAASDTGDDTGSDVPAADDASVSAPPEAVGSRPLTSRELRRLWSHVGQVENFWSSLGEIEPGAVARLYALATTRRWEILFLTQRPASAGDLVQTQTHHWLRTHGFETPSVFVMRSGSRGRVADALALDVVIDDRPENCLDVVTDSKAKPILVWRMRPEMIPPGMPGTSIEVVYSMHDALDRLEQLAQERARRRTFMGRLRSAIVPR